MIIQSVSVPGYTIIAPETSAENRGPIMNCFHNFLKCFACGCSINGDQAENAPDIQLQEPVTRQPSVSRTSEVVGPKAASKESRDSINNAVANSGYNAPVNASRPDVTEGPIASAFHGGVRKDWFGSTRSVFANSGYNRLTPEPARKPAATELPSLVEFLSGVPKQSVDSIKPSSLHNVPKPGVVLRPNAPERLFGFQSSVKNQSSGSITNALANIYSGIYNIPTPEKELRCDVTEGPTPFDVHNDVRKQSEDVPEGPRPVAFQAGVRKQSSDLRAEARNSLSPNALRKKAQIYFFKRNFLRHKGQIARRNRNFKLAQQCFEAAQAEHERFQDANNKAAAKYLKENNDCNKENVLDLHHLFVKEAIQALNRFLDDKIEELDDDEQMIVATVITGRGKHSPDGVPKIKLAAIETLRKRRIMYRNKNPGCLTVRITPNALHSAEPYFEEM